MIHKPRLVTELRELPPQGRWARNEPTGRATVVCSCGLNTGWIPKTDAMSTVRSHTGHGR